MKSIMKLTDRLLVKCSPLLDISFIIETVESLKHIYVICFKGECKELLIEIVKDSCLTGITVIDLDMNNTISRFEYMPSPIESQVKTEISEPKSPIHYIYLYEPNAGVMKTGAWKQLLIQYPDLRKADPNTHLFFSDTLYGDFPGRVLEITGQPDKKDLRKLKGAKYNVVVRNYPLSAPEVSKKHSLKSGGDRFLYAFRYKGKPVIVTAEYVRENNQ